MSQVVQETQGDKRPTALAGLYRHRESGAEVIAIETEKFGNPQGDAYVRLGFEYVGPVEGKDLEAANAVPQPNAPQVSTDPSVKSVSQLEVELQAAKSREAEWAQRREENEAKAEEESQADDVTELEVPAQTVEVEAPSQTEVETPASEESAEENDSSDESNDGPEDEEGEN